MRASSPTRWENFAIHQAPLFTFRGPLHTRPCGATLSKQERAGIPLIRHALRRATFPGGEGFLRRGYDTGRFLRRVLQDQPFQGFFQFFLVYAGIIDDQAVQVCGLGIKGAEGLDLQALGEKCLGQGFVR